MSQNKNVLQNTWFLVGCALFAIGSLVSIILGAVTSSPAAIVVGVIVLLACIGLFISGLVDRRHIPSQRQRAT